MSRTEQQENAAIARLTNGRQSAAYRSARRANIPVTVVRGDIIYRVTNEGSVAIGKVPPKVKVIEKTVVLN